MWPLTPDFEIRSKTLGVDQRSSSFFPLSFASCISRTRTRTHGPVTRSGAAGSSSGVRQPPQVLRDSSSEPETEDETPIQVAGPRPAAVREDTSQQANNRTQPGETTPAPARSRRTTAKAGAPVPPINWMRGAKAI